MHLWNIYFIIIARDVFFYSSSCVKAWRWKSDLMFFPLAYNDCNARFGIKERRNEIRTFHTKPEIFQQGHETCSPSSVEYSHRIFITEQKNNHIFLLTTKNIGEEQSGRRHLMLIHQSGWCSFLFPCETRKACNRNLLPLNRLRGQLS